MENLVTPPFWHNKKVLITGHTGFKGSWLSRVLINFGAEITGYSLKPPTNPNLFSIADLQNNMNSVIGDIRDYDKLKSVFDTFRPEIVLHLAAQPIVRDSYKNPRYTYETNVMGTVNILECVRLSETVKSLLNVTTDKVYKNNEWEWGYRENEPLDGFDPYSNSKSCSELATHSYNDSFLKEKGIAISTARAGNVIGGGDFATDRIIPDCVRAVQTNTIIEVRNPFSTRPYQHVLEPILAYLMIVERQFTNSTYSGWYNIGPEEKDCVTTGELVEKFCRYWGNNAKWTSTATDGPHEANFLKLDCSKIKQKYKWNPKWNIDTALQKTCEWTRAFVENADIPYIMNRQITDYIGDN